VPWAWIMSVFSEEEGCLDGECSGGATAAMEAGAVEPCCRSFAAAMEVDEGSGGDASDPPLASDDRRR
jgi:hypothetical protein